MYYIRLISHSCHVWFKILTSGRVNMREVQLSYHIDRQFNVLKCVGKRLNYFLPNSDHVQMPLGKL